MAHSSLSEIAEAVDGDIYLDAFLDNSDGTGQALGATDKLLVSSPPNETVPLSESVFPCSPALTFKKFLTMQVFHSLACVEKMDVVKLKCILSSCLPFLSMFCTVAPRVNEFQWPFAIPRTRA